MKLSKRLRSYLPSKFRNRNRRRRLDYYADGIGVRHKNISHLTEEKFFAAWQFALEGNKDGWVGSHPDVRWRASVGCWAATHALHLPGQFVECGVNTGLLSMTVCHYLDFQSIDRKFYLYDTFNGIPIETLQGEELRATREINAHNYFDCFEIAKRNFESFANVELIRGSLPGSLDIGSPEQIAYLSIDLNNATFERQTMDVLWNRLAPGAIVVIDDYAFKGHEEQYQMWNEFAAQNSSSVLALPTGQGLLIRPPF